MDVARNLELVPMERISLATPTETPQKEETPIRATKAEVRKANQKKKGDGKEKARRAKRTSERRRREKGEEAGEERPCLEAG